MGVQINGSTGAVTGTQSDWSGNVSIGGTLTYEDVTNIDAVGLITARTGIEFGARPGVAASISADGNMIMSGITTLGTQFTSEGGFSVVNGAVTIPDSIIHDGDTNTKIRFPTTDVVSVETAGGERLRINSSGNLCVNTTDATGLFGQSTPILTYSPKLGVQGSIIIGNLSSTTSDRHELQFYRRGGSSAGTPVTSHDMGRIAWYGSSNDSDNADMAWAIGVTPDGGDWTSGGNRKGYMSFTNQDGEKLRISSGGLVRIGASTDEDVHTGEGADLQVVSTDGGGLTLARDDSTVSNGANLGVIRAYGNDSNGTYQEVASLQFQADLNHGTGDKPGRLVFSTTADGASTVTERLRVDSGGRVLFGNYFTSQQIGNYTSAIQVQGTDHNTSSLSIFRYSNDDGGAQLTIGKSRGTSGGAVDKCSDQDNIGSIRFVMANNADLINGNVARIDCNADGVPSGGDTPGRISFWVSPDGSSTPVETVRMKANGSLLCKGKYNNQTGSAFMEIGNGHISIADESSVTLSSAANTGVLVSIGVNKGATGNMTYDHGLFFCSYGVTNSVEVADGGGDFSNSDTNGYLCVYTSGNANVVVKNRLGHTTNVSIGLIRYLGN